VTTSEPLPEDIDALKVALAAERAARQQAEARASGAEAMVAHLKLLIAKLRRERFGPSAEQGRKLLDQLELQLEELEAGASEDEAAAENAADTTVRPFTRRRPVRAPLPAHLPRERVVIAGPIACPCCGGKLAKLGEDITETLEVVPRQWKVIQTVREKFTCRSCERITQPPAPFHVISRARAGANLLAMILYAKFGQHQPLNRQSEVYAREGIELDTSTLADWVGACSATLAPLIELIRRHVLAADRLHGDDTTVPVLAKNKTATGRLWTYVRDDRPFAGPEPPAAMFFYSRNRSGEHPHRHLAGYTGILQADAYAGFGDLYDARRRPGPITEAACWSHGRRKFFELADLRKAPLAIEAVHRVDAIFAIERAINGAAAGQRLAIRQDRVAPLVAELESWMRTERARLSRHAETAKAIDYMLKRWAAFTRFLDDGRICLTNNAAERALRGIATTESFCALSSSICKHWNLILHIEVTRATFTPHRPHDALALEIGGADLIGRAWNNLLGGKHADLDQPSNTMACNPKVLGGFSHCQPGAVLLSGAIGVDAANPPDRSDPMSRPGLTLTRRQSHAVQCGGDVLVRPAGRHAADDGQSVVRSAAVMLARTRLAEPQLRVLPALPMDGENDLAGLFIEVGGDLVDQRSQELLTSAHGHARGLPRRLEIFRDPREIGLGRRGMGSRRRVQPQLAILNAA
jgi:transposase